ncbi:CYTH domain-containing protein [Salinibius halmophilus]|uniref:hypothetical protein n=1 Tax=Salinibius halmophilus TaxID=1853216 RepID=UPI000E663A7D|nr:hypothetical protein [Salinibius halmophilus]
MKYSELEIERRWLVHEDELPDFSELKVKILTDLYITDSRLRLRKEESIDSIKYKLCKKYGKTSAICEPITNIYLSETEYGFLSKLEGIEVVRHRYYFPYNGVKMSINVGRNIPTILEAEFTSEAEALAFLPPRFAAKEVSDASEYEVASMATYA